MTVLEINGNFVHLKIAETLRLSELYMPQQLYFTKTFTLTNF